MLKNDKMKQQHTQNSDWLDQQVAAGKEVYVSWDGGDDSGGAQLHIDGKGYYGGMEDKIPGLDIRRIIENAYTELDYGSWAGEFSAQGEAYYDPKTKSFQGVDTYESSNTIVTLEKVSFRVPQSIYFDALDCRTESVPDDQPDSTPEFVDFLVKNGPKSNATMQDELDILDQIDEIGDRIVADFMEKSSSHDMEIDRIRLVYNEVIPRSAGVPDGEDLVFTLLRPMLELYTRTKKSIVIPAN